MQILKKLSTITRREWAANPAKYKIGRDQNLDIIVNSKPRMNINVTISTKPF